MGEDFWNPKREVQPPADDPAWTTPLSGDPRPPDAPPWQTPAWPPPGATPAPGLPPLSGSAEQYPVPPWVEPPRFEPPRQPRSKIVLGAIGGLAAVVGIIAVKVGTGFLAGTVLSGAASAFFGGPFSRLPEDQRQAYEQRLEAAVGDKLDGLSARAANDRVQDWITGGLLRMDDVRLVRRLELEMRAIFAADEATCADFARQAFTGVIGQDISSRILNALDTTLLGEWIGMNIDAVEAEMRATPDQLRASEVAIDGAFDRLIRSLAEPTTITITVLADGLPTDNTEACAAVRNFYAAAVNLDEHSRGVIARYDVQSLE